MRSQTKRENTKVTFAKPVEETLLDKEAPVAVHSVSNVSSKENEKHSVENIPIQTSTPEKNNVNKNNSLIYTDEEEINENIDGKNYHSAEDGEKVYSCDDTEHEENNMTQENQLPEFKTIRELLQHTTSSSELQDNKLEHFSLVPAGTYMGSRRIQPHESNKPTKRQSEGGYISSELAEHRKEPRRHSSEYCNYRERPHHSRYESRNKPLIGKKSTSDTLVPSWATQNHSRRSDTYETEKPERSVVVHKNSAAEIQNIDDFEADDTGRRESEFFVKSKEEAGLNSSSLSDSGSSLHGNLMDIINKHEQATNKNGLAITSVAESELYLENASPIGTHIRVQSHKFEGSLTNDVTTASVKKQSIISQSVGQSSARFSSTPSTATAPGKKSANFKSSLLGNLTTGISSDEDIVYENDFSTDSLEGRTLEKSFTELDISNTAKESQPKSPGNSSLLKGLLEALGMGN